MKYPSWHLFSGRTYTPSNQTDIRKTFEKAREKLSREINNVRQIKREKKS